MNKEMILVVGASGTVGSELVRILKSEGHAVRTTTSKKTVAEDQVHVDLATGEGITAAFEGVSRAFLLSPPGYADQYSMLVPLIQESKRRGLKKVVLMTAMGANAVETTPFRRAEIELEKSGLDYTILRPNWFFQNFHTFWIQGIREQSAILLPAGNAKVSFIDARDISAVAAKALTGNVLSRQDADLTGPQEYTHEDVAKEISKVTGKTVVYKDIAPEELKQGLLKAGLPEDYSNFLIMIFGFLREGYSARRTDIVKQVTGREPIGLKAYVHDHQRMWK